VGQDCMTISEWAGVEADLVDLAPMAERPHSHTCDLPPRVPRTNTTNVPHSVKVYDRPVHRRYEFINILRPIRPKQRWYFVPEMRKDEALLLKCYDPARDGRAILSPHGASEDSTAPADVLPRESIELRTIAFHSA
jgi:hypothetical protein